MQGAFVKMDFETRSPTDLRKSGVYRYVEDPQTDAWGFSYRYNENGPLQRWRLGQPLPQDLCDHIAIGGMVKAHNAAFERNIWNSVIRRHFPDAPIMLAEQMDCTMARAAAISHPQDLDKLCTVLQTKERKDKEGYNLMMKMARPRGYKPDGTPIWWDEPHNVERLEQYQDQDVRTESEIDTIIPQLTDYEREVWLLDQKINDRGVPLDIDAARRCVDLVAIAKKEADKEMRTLTGRTVPKCSNDGKIIEFIQSRGIECTTVKKGVQDDLLFMADLQGDDIVRQVIELRKAAKKTSTAKYEAMTKCVSSDGRARGLLYLFATVENWLAAPALSPLLNISWPSQ